MKKNTTHNRISAYVAEFLAVFALTLAVSLSMTPAFSEAFAIIPTPVVAALVVGLFVYTIGSISGAHINPAITLGLAATRKIDLIDTLFYLVFQFGGAVLSYLLLYSVDLAPAVNIVGASGDFLSMIDGWETFIVEALGAFFLAFGVASVAWGKATQSASGFVIGGSLFLGIIMAVAVGSKGILNPAVALGIGELNLWYALGPIAGSMLAMFLYSGLARD